MFKLSVNPASADRNDAPENIESRLITKDTAWVSLDLIFREYLRTSGTMDLGSRESGLLMAIDIARAYMRGLLDDHMKRNHSKKVLENDILEISAKGIEMLEQGRKKGGRRYTGTVTAKRRWRRRNGPFNISKYVELLANYLYIRR